MTREDKTSSLEIALMTAEQECGKYENLLAKAVISRETAADDLHSYIEESEDLANKLPAQPNPIP